MVNYEGGATAAVLKLREGMILETAVLGDSGFSLFSVNELGRLVLRFKSPSYASKFNQPD